MATLEGKEFIDYTLEKMEKLLKPENFMLKDLDKMHLRIKRIDEKLKRIIEKIETLENRTRSLERANIFDSSDSSD